MINNNNADANNEAEEHKLNLLSQPLESKRPDGDVLMTPVGDGRVPAAKRPRSDPEINPVMGFDREKFEKHVKSTHNSFCNEQIVAFKRKTRRLRSAQSAKSRLTKQKDKGMPRWAACSLVGKVQVPKAQTTELEKGIKKILTQAAESVFNLVVDINSTELTCAKDDLDDWPKTLEKECKAASIRGWNSLPEFLRDGFNSTEFTANYSNILFDHIQQQVIAWQLREAEVFHNRELSQASKKIAANAKAEEFTKFKATCGITKDTVIETLVQREVKRAMKEKSQNSNNPASKEQPKKTPSKPSKNPKPHNSDKKAKNTTTKGGKGQNHPKNTGKGSSSGKKSRKKRKGKKGAKNAPNRG